MNDPADHGLEYLLAFNGRIHHFEKGYWVKFEITKGEATDRRPHGLSYSFTLHAPDGRTHDHWHRDRADQGRPYVFKDATTLLEDFQIEVERVLKERGISSDVVETGGKED